MYYQIKKQDTETGYWEAIETIDVPSDFCKQVSHRFLWFKWTSLVVDHIAFRKLAIRRAREYGNDGIKLIYCYCDAYDTCKELVMKNGKFIS